MSFVSGFFKKIFQPKNKVSVAPEQQVENGKPDTDVIEPNTAQAIITSVAENKNTASAVLSDTAPEAIKAQPEKPLKVNILDEGRTLVFSSEKTPRNIEQPSEVVVNKDEVNPSGMSADLPKGLTADFVQQLLRKHETEKASQAIPPTPESTFTPFIYRLTCQQCKLNGEIEVYTATYICPKCGGEMRLSEMKLDEKYRDNPNIKNVLVKFWDNYMDDQSAQQQWNLLSASRDLELINMMLNVAHKINGDNEDQAFSSIDSLLNAKQKLQAVTHQKSELAADVRTTEEPAFTITSLNVPIEKTTGYYRRTFCYRCHMALSYPTIMDGANITCPACQCLLVLPGAANKYKVSGTIKRVNVDIRTNILEGTGATACTLQEVNELLQMDLDDKIYEARSKFYLSNKPVAKFDLLDSFNQFFSIKDFYKSELIIFSLLKMLFYIYLKNSKSTGVKISDYAIVVKEHANRQFALFPNVILCRTESTIITRPLNSILWSVSERLTEQKASISAYRTTWLHTRKDGEPDGRYSYNPQKQIPAVYDLGANSHYYCKLEIEDWCWEFFVGELAVKQLISLTEAWNSSREQISKR